MEEEQKIKIEYTKDKLKMEISIDDLIELFETSEYNYNGETNLYHIKENQKKSFLKYIKDYLLSFCNDDSNLTKWAIPFEDCWEEMIANDEDFLESIIKE